MKKLLLILLIAVTAVSCSKYDHKKADWKIVIGPMNGSGTPDPNNGFYYQNLEVISDDYSYSPPTIGYTEPTFEHTYRGKFYNKFKIYVANVTGSKISLYRDGELIKESSKTYDNLLEWTNE